MSNIKHPTHSGFWANIFKSNNNLSEIESIFLSTPIFKKLDKKDFNAMSDVIHKRSYVAGEYIFCQGDPSVALHIILEGEVEIKRELPNNNFLTLAHLYKGDFFGELALVDNGFRNANAVAVTPTNLILLCKPDLDDYIKKCPSKGVSILESLGLIASARLRKVNEENNNLIIQLNKFKEVRNDS